MREQTILKHLNVRNYLLYGIFSVIALLGLASKNFLIFSGSIVVILFLIPRFFIEDRMFHPKSFYNARPIRQTILFRYKIHNIFVVGLILLILRLAFEAFDQLSFDLLFLSFVTSILPLVALSCLAITIAILTQDLRSYFVLMLVGGLVLFAGFLGIGEYFSYLQVKSPIELQTGIILHSSLKRLSLLQILFVSLLSLLTIFLTYALQYRANREKFPQIFFILACVFLFLLFSLPQITNSFVPRQRIHHKDFSVTFNNPAACQATATSIFGSNDIVKTQITTKFQTSFSDPNFFALPLTVTKLSLAATKPLEQADSIFLKHTLSCLDSTWLLNWLKVNLLSETDTIQLRQKECQSPILSFHLPKQHTLRSAGPGEIVTRVGIFQPFVDYTVKLYENGVRSSGGYWKIKAFEVESPAREIVIEEEFTPGLSAFLPSNSQYPFDSKVPNLISSRYVLINENTGRVFLLSLPADDLQINKEQEYVKSKRLSFPFPKDEDFMNPTHYRLIRLSFRPIAIEEMTSSLNQTTVTWGKETKSQ